MERSNMSEDSHPDLLIQERGLLEPLYIPIAHNEPAHKSLNELDSLDEEEYNNKSYFRSERHIPDEDKHSLESIISHPFTGPAHVVDTHTSQLHFVDETPEGHAPSHEHEKFSIKQLISEKFTDQRKRSASPSPKGPTYTYKVGSGPGSNPIVSVTENDCSSEDQDSNKPIISKIKDVFNKLTHRNEHSEAHHTNIPVVMATELQDSMRFN